MEKKKMTVKTGLDRLLSEKQLQDNIKGNVGYLCHSASVDSHLQHGLHGLKKLFGKRLAKVFGPQHGFQTNVQDNMVETDHFTHPYFQLKIYSLYNGTRAPTDEMLQDLDTVLVDLQDVGTRIYTYIYTMTLLMEACGKKNIKVIILDRPNPIGGTQVEGNVLDPKFASFVGRHPLPIRHGMTIGEIASLATQSFGIECDCEIIQMKGWQRDMYFNDTGLPWVMPSPNLPTAESTITFPSTVLFEGTNISEGRGTTHSLEMIGHPAIEPYRFLEELAPKIKEASLKGFTLRPCNFLPTFNKHAKHLCGGFQIHVTDRESYTPWKLGQFLLREFYQKLNSQFKWKADGYEYEFNSPAIDFINGTDKLRLWVETNGSMEQLRAIESASLKDFMPMRDTALIYK